MVEALRLEKINGDQRYDIVFNSTKTGKRSCIKTARRLNKLPRQLKEENVTSTVHENNCKGFESVLSCTLNNKGLKWVRIGNM